MRYQRAIVAYNDASKALILPFKPASRLDLTPLIAQMMLPQFERLVGDKTLVMPIPLHFTRRLYRRYNQSAEIARALCIRANKAAQLDVISLYRRKATSSLAHHNKSKRDNILRHAFAIRDPSGTKLEGRPILLIDDVMTTGRTAHHAAKCLLAHGAGPIDCLTFARVL